MRALSIELAVAAGCAIAAIAGGCGGASAGRDASAATSSPARHIVLEEDFRSAPRAAGARTLAAAGDIACPPVQAPARYACHQASTARLIARLHPDAVALLGDEQYDRGTAGEFAGSFARSWGRLRAALHPAPGNHEYSDGAARGYFGYFGARAGSPARGYYSWDLGAWHMVALNSNCDFVSCAAGSAQVRWLRRDLARSHRRCTLAYWHHARFSSGLHGDSDAVAPLFATLYRAGADVVLSGHDHIYERFAPQDPQGRPDASRGVREFVAGTGGVNHYPILSVKPNSEVRDDGSFGVLLLTLRARAYSWRFVPDRAGGFTDAGSARCH
jgi:hypothetical protein